MAKTRRSSSIHSRVAVRSLLKALRLGCEDVRQRSQPCRLSDSQGDARRHPTPRGRPRRGSAPRRIADQTAGRARAGRRSIRKTRTALRQSPTSGRGPCAANLRTAVPRSLSCAHSGFRRRAGSQDAGTDGPVSSAPQADRLTLTCEIFEPTTAKDVPRGTVALAKATVSGMWSRLATWASPRLRWPTGSGNTDPIFDDWGQRIGGARLLAVVTLRPRETRSALPTAVASDYAAVRVAAERSQKAFRRRHLTG